MGSGADTLSVLTSRGPALAKQWLADGTITDYDDAKYYTLATRTICGIADLSALLTGLERKPKTCIIRGRFVGHDRARERDSAEFKPEFVRRSLDYFEDQPLHTLLVDVDKFAPVTCDALDAPQEAIEEFISTRLPPEFAGASYHWQLSNSAGHPSKGRGLRAHLWFWSSQALTCAQLTAWAKRTAFAGDVALFRTVQVHYTAAPVMAEGVADPYPTRSGFVDGWAGDSVMLDLDAVALAAEPAEISRGVRLAAVVSDDPIATALYDLGMVRSQARDGALNIECPFSGEHSTGAGAETSTQYFPPHTGGYAVGHFKCLHGTCEGRHRGLFLEALGLPNDGPTVADPDEFPDESVAAAAAEQAKVSRFTPLALTDFTSRPAPSWIVKGLLPKAGLVVLYGASGAGKSFVTLDIVAAVARGVQWRGLRVRQGRVVYIAAEGAGGFRNRCVAYLQANNLQASDLDALQVIADRPNFLKDDAKAIAKAVGKADIIVIDTFAQVTPGANENAGEDMGKALDQCALIHATTGATVVLVHHAGKDTSKGARGWSGIRAAADAELEVERSAFGRVLRTTKQKDGDDTGEWGFELEVLQIGVDEDLDPITSCIVAEREVNKTKAVGRKLGQIEALVNEVIQEFAQAQTTGIEVQAVVDEAIRRMAKPEGKTDTRRQVVKRAVKTLCSSDVGLYELAEDNTISVP